MPVTTVILAGGRGVRIGGNKGLQLLQGKPLLEWVLQAVTPQGGAVLINANEQLENYRQFGYPVISDLMQGWQGPLAGLQAGMQHAATEFVLTVPCDTPFLPLDLVPRLYAGVGDGEAAVAVVAGRRQPAIAIYRRDLLPRLSVMLEGGMRKVGDWLNTLRVHEVIFENENMFNNINTLDDMTAAGQEAAIYLHGAKNV